MIIYCDPVKSTKSETGRTAEKRERDQRDGVMRDELQKKDERETR
jgi:hypothetical protein